MAYLPKRSKHKGGLFNALNKKSRKLDETITFIKVMEIAGGYSEVKNMPTLAYNQIVKGLEEIAKRENENSKKGAKRKGK